MSAIWAIGAGLATPAPDGESILEAWYPLLLLPDEAQAGELDAVLRGQRGMVQDASAVAELLAGMVGKPDLAELAYPVGERQPVCCVLAADEPIADTAAAYLKLHLLSARLVRPNSLDLSGLFERLPNLAWTSVGPVPPEQVDSVRLDERRRGRELWVHAVDKFPPLTQYLVPPGVRIADSARVRLGAWIGEGTTVMHSGSINFNAGTEGVAMVEGRVAQGVVVGQQQ